MSREWRLYVADMKACCERAAEYTTDLSREEFEAKRMAYDATLRNSFGTTLLPCAKRSRSC